MTTTVQHLCNEKGSCVCGECQCTAQGGFYKGPTCEDCPVSYIGLHVHLAFSPRFNKRTHSILPLVGCFSACSLPQYNVVFSARCNIDISRLCYDVSVRLSVTEVHWRIIANLGFKFRSQFTAHCGRGACGRARGKGSLPERVEGSSRAMLATSRPSCCLYVIWL